MKKILDENMLYICQSEFVPAYLAALWLQIQKAMPLLLTCGAEIQGAEELSITSVANIQVIDGERSQVTKLHTVSHWVRHSHHDFVTEILKKEMNKVKSIEL